MILHMHVSTYKTKKRVVTINIHSCFIFFSLVNIGYENIAYLSMLLLSDGTVHESYVYSLELKCFDY